MNIDYIKENGYYCYGVDKKFDPVGDVEIWKCEKKYFWLEKRRRTTRLRKNVIEKVNFKAIRLSDEIRPRRKIDVVEKKKENILIKLLKCFLKCLKRDTF